MQVPLKFMFLINSVNDQAQINNKNGGIFVDVACILENQNILRRILKYTYLSFCYRRTSCFQGSYTN